MSSFTAQLLIGEDRSDGLAYGRPIKQLLLSENGKPVWHFFGNRSLTNEPIATWIPGPTDTILETGLIMADYFVAKN